MILPFNFIGIATEVNFISYAHPVSLMSEHMIYLSYLGDYSLLPTLCGHPALRVLLYQSIFYLIIAPCERVYMSPFAIMRIALSSFRKNGHELLGDQQEASCRSQKTSQVKASPLSLHASPSLQMP